MKNVFIISGPSGSGQDSLIQGLKKIFSINVAVTSTTRSKREGESEGHPYYFLTKEAFETGIQEGKFLEYAKTYNEQYYGVTYEEMNRLQKSEKIGIWKIDWRGVETAKRIFPSITAILITAPLPVLEDRIRKRDNPSEEFIAERMEYTKEFLKHSYLYDYIIENEQGKLDQSIEKIRSVINERLSSK